MLLKILAGLVGLGIVVFIHELGHFVVAKLVGIEVEAFSVGWGRKIASFKKGKTEYRLSLLPIGGYCKMKGEDVLKKAWENNSSEVEKEPGSFFGASPLRRILVSLAGPFFNLLLSVVAIFFIWFFGYSYPSFSNRIVLASDYSVQGQATTEYPADKANLHTGDRIIAINGKKTTNFRDIQEKIATSPDEKLTLTVESDGSTRTVGIVPSLDKETGGGYIGIHAWIDPVVDTVLKDSGAYIGGLKSGDRILSINGKAIENTLDFRAALQGNPSSLSVTFERNGERKTTTIVPQYDENGIPGIGIAFKPTIYRTPHMNIAEAFWKGIEETGRTLYLTVKGLGLLVKGVDVTQAVSGPIRITYYIGEVATQGFQEGFSTGISSVASFLSFISVALAFMNLLPFPVFDGGMIVLFLIEMIRRKPVKPKTFYRYQMVGVFIIFALILFAVFGDVSFLIRQ